MTPPEGRPRGGQ